MKFINGTWFEFQHHNKPEGKYYNPQSKEFTDEQWRTKIREYVNKFILIVNARQNLLTDSRKKNRLQF